MTKLFTAIMLLVSVIVGYFSNIFWLFSHSESFTPEFFIAALGVVVPPLGVLHGWWSFF